MRGPQVLTVVFLTDLWRALPDRPRRGFDPCHVRRRVRVSLHLGLHLRVPAVHRPGDQRKGPEGLAARRRSTTTRARTRSWSPRTRARGRALPRHAAQEALGRDDDRDRVLCGPLPGHLLRRLGLAVPGGRLRPGDLGELCASCHAGPAGTFGGTKAGRPFQVIAAYAGLRQGLLHEVRQGPEVARPLRKDGAPSRATRTPSCPG